MFQRPKESELKFGKSSKEHAETAKCLLPVGISTSENLVEEFGISKQQQDLMSYESHMKAS